MGMVDQVYREVEVAPLTGVLAEIQRVLDRVRNPGDALEEQEALASIARLTAKPDRSPVYQKPWG